MNEAELTAACTADHPDHQYLFEVQGKPLLWTAWCTVCESKGYNNNYNNNHHNQPNPDMGAVYVETVREAACLVHAEQERLSAKRRQQRLAKLAQKERQP